MTARGARLCLLLALLLACGRVAADALPILFVHGNGDSAAVWMTDLWRFESNGYDPALLATLDFTHPKARAADSVAEVNRSSSEDQRRELAAAVDRLRAATHQDKVVLVGSSRGGNAIRNFIRHGGQDKVAIAILCGTPNHGVFRLPFRWDFEFNGIGPFLRHLNHPSETDPGVRFVTLRSDHNDKFAQPFGAALGLPYLPTLVGSDGPALEGAENIVLPGLDHREVAFHRRAFAALYQAIAGTAPVTLDPTPEPAPQLGGMISGSENGAPTNLPLAGVRLEIYRIDPDRGERLGAPLWQQTSAADGRWGPFPAQPDAYYEFVATAAGYPATHIYHTPFPRSSNVVQIRLAPSAQDGVVTLVRARGYFGRGRDDFAIDGQPPDGVPEGVPTADHGWRAIPGTPRAVRLRFNDEHLTVHSAPAGETVIAELTD